MRFTLRDLLWLIALIAMGLSWWLDVRRRDGAVESAQLRKDYYNMMAEAARSDIERTQEMQKQLIELTRRESEKAAEPNAGTN